MDIFKAIGGTVGTAVGGPLGGVVGGGAGSFIDSLFGGGSSGGSSSDSSDSGVGAAPIDYFARFGAEAAAANSPITLAGTRYGSVLGSQAGALGLLGSTLAGSNRNILTGAINRAQIADLAKGAEIKEATAGKFDVQQQATAGQYNLANTGAQGRIALSLINPQAAAAAGAAALKGDIDLQQGLASTNQNIKAAQELAGLNIAQQYAQNLGQAFLTRAATEGNLATGAQNIAGQLALGRQAGDIAMAQLDQQLVGNLTMNKAKTESDIARLRANTDATIRLRKDNMDRTLGGQRYFG